METSGNLQIIGHRGAAGLAFENTLAGFQKALDLGVKIMELDVWLTTDQEVVVFHDAYLDRLTDETGFISDKDYQSLQKIPLKNGDRIPTLQEVIALVKPHAVQLVVELKAEKALPETLLILENELPYSRFVIGSFFHDVIRKLKKEKPEVRTAIMLECVPAGLETYLNLVDPEMVVASIETFNQELIGTVKSQNRKLVFYTVNSEVEITLALGAEPYGIVTNYPDRFLTSA